MAYQIFTRHIWESGGGGGGGVFLLHFRSADVNLVVFSRFEPRGFSFFSFLDGGKDGALELVKRN